MSTTTVINNTDSEIHVKEGNLGVWTLLQKLGKNGEKDSSCTLTVDTNATYREYWIAVLSDSKGKKFIVSSDDCVDNKTLVIKLDAEKNEYVCEKTPRGSEARAATSTSTNQKTMGFFKRIQTRFSKGGST